MTNLNITTTYKVTVNGYSLTAGDLKTFLEAIPDDASVTVRQVSGDRPGETGVIYLEATVKG